MFGCTWYTLVCSSDKTIPLHIFSPLESLKFEARYITAQWGRFQNRINTLCFHLLCWSFANVVVVVVVVFHRKVRVSLILDSFLDEASNFHSRILANQNQKFVA